MGSIQSQMHPDTYFLIKPITPTHLVLQMIEPAYGAASGLGTTTKVIARAFKGDNFNDFRWMAKCLATFHKKSYIELNLEGYEAERIEARND